MSLTREDMLRELELLPVWRLRTPSVMTESVPQVLVEKPATETVTEKLVNQSGSSLAEVTHVIDAAVKIQTDITPSPTQEIVEVAVAEIAPEVLIKTTWCLLCPQASDESSQQLLQNLMRALKLPSDEVLLQQQPLQIAQTQSRFCVLFGLQAANDFLGTSHADMISVRGQLLKHGELTYVITHHPHAMLENPALKKEVWHDVCLLLAEK